MSRKITISMDEHSFTIDAQINSKTIHVALDRNKGYVSPELFKDDAFDNVNKITSYLMYDLNVRAMERYIDNHCTQITLPDDIPDECKEELKKALYMDEFDDKNNIITFNSYRTHGDDSIGKYWYQNDYNAVWKSLHEIFDKYNINDYKFRELD
jgi:hypothetical protein